MINLSICVDLGFYHASIAFSNGNLIINKVLHSTYHFVANVFSVKSTDSAKVDINI